MRFAAIAAAVFLAGACSQTYGDRIRVSDGRTPVTDREIDKLIARLQHDHDFSGHLDYTRAVFELIDVGKPAVPKLVALMENTDNEISRIRVQRALDGIVLTHFGFRFGQGWGEIDRHEEAYQMLATLGELDPHAPAEERRAAALRWREWAARPADNQPIKKAEPLSRPPTE